MRLPPNVRMKLSWRGGRRKGSRRFCVAQLGLRTSWRSGDGTGTACQVSRSEGEIILYQNATRRGSAPTYTLALLTIIAALLAACGGPPSQAGPLALPPCAVPGVGTPDSVWHEVRASGFTFCVPPAWEPSGNSHTLVQAKRWHRGGSSLTWDLGRPHSFIAPDVVFTVTGRIVQGTNPRPLPTTPPQPCSPQRNTPLVVGGMTLLVAQIDCQGTWTTTALSTMPSIYVQGEAHSAKEAETLLLIMQTIRPSLATH